MKTDKKGVKSSHGGSSSKGGRAPINMAPKGNSLSKTKGGMAKSTSQPSKKDCKY